MYLLTRIPSFGEKTVNFFNENGYDNNIRKENNLDKREYLVKNLLPRMGFEPTSPTCRANALPIANLSLNILIYPDYSLSLN